MASFPTESLVAFSPQARGFVQNEVRPEDAIFLASPGRRAEHFGNIRMRCDFGTFEGFNFRDQSAIERNLTAEEVTNRNHDGEGEAEFWASGDHVGVSKVFRETNIGYVFLSAPGTEAPGPNGTLS